MNSDGYPNKGLPDITTSGEFLQTNSDLRAVWGAGGGSGSTETASNVGSFTGVFKQKTGNDLEFRTLQSSDNSIILGSNTNDIDFSN